MRTHERTGAWWAKDRKTLTARGVIFAAGALGTNRLLAACKHGGSLPNVSAQLGELVRTNSETMLAVTMPRDVRERAQIGNAPFYALLARQFLREYRTGSAPFRFDVLAIEAPPGGHPVVRLHKGAFAP